MFELETFVAEYVTKRRSSMFLEDISKNRYLIKLCKDELIRRKI